MNVTNPIIRRIVFDLNYSAVRLAFMGATLAVAGTASQSALGQGTHLWTQSKLEDFEKGTPQGVALTSDGHLREGPGLSDVLTTPSTFVWSVAVDKNGTAYLGTASPATVLRVGADGKPFTLFETKDLSVQVVRLGSDGAIYAATLPSGKVYRLKADATVKQNDTNTPVVFDAGAFDGMSPEDKAKSGDPAAADDRRQDGRWKDRFEIALHLGYDLRFDRPALYCDGRTGSCLSRGCSCDRREAGGLFQER